MKKIIYLILLFAVFASCKFDDKPYSIIREFDGGTYITPDGIVKYISGSPDSLISVSDNNAVIQENITYVKKNLTSFRFGTIHPTQHFADEINRFFPRVFFRFAFFNQLALHFGSKPARPFPRGNLRSSRKDGFQAHRALDALGRDPRAASTAELSVLGIASVIAVQV